MKINFYPQRLFDLSSGFAALGAAGPVGLGLAGAQTALGIVQAISGGARSKRLMRQRRAYQTPEEIFDILKAQQNRASEGYDPQTLNYLTGQVDRTSASSLDAAARLGADPNQLSAMIDQAIQSKFRIGAENQLQNMKNFGGYIDALGLVASNDAAEQKSREDLLKDQLQAASMQQQSGMQNIVGGANTALSTLSSASTADLYADKTANPMKPLPKASQLGLPGGTSFDFAPTTLPPAVGLSDYIPSAPVRDRIPTSAELQNALDLLNRTGILQRR